MRFVIVPVKELSKAKNRLSGVLSNSQRVSLAKAMLRDVLTELKKCMLADKICILTSDPDVKQIALEFSFDIIHEDEQSSESRSVDRGSVICMEMGASSVLRIPGDAPLLKAKDIDSLFENEKPYPHVILVPSLDETGTNAILRKPPDSIPSRFGEGSLMKHLNEAHNAKLPVQIIRNRRLGLDVDNPDDLKNLIREISNLKDKHTYSELLKIGLINETRTKIA